MSENGSKEIPEISRRRFIGIVGGMLLGGAGAIDAARGFSGKSSLSKDWWEKGATHTIGKDADKMRAELEAKYKVMLASPNTGLSFLRANESIEFANSRRVGWDAPRIKALSEVLETLPPSFYIPRMVNGRRLPLAVSLSDWDLRTPEMKHRGGLYCQTADNLSGLIFLNKRSLGQTPLAQEHSERNIIHEFVHHATSPRLDALGSEAKDILGVSEDSQLGILFNTHLLKEFAEQVDNPQGLSLRGDKEPSLIDQRIMYGGTNIAELVAVAGEQFHEGKEQFIHGYSNFIGPGKAEQFYDFTRQNIYEGREY